jgi:hypothetical protein
MAGPAFLKEIIVPFSVSAALNFRVFVAVIYGVPDKVVKGPLQSEGITLDEYFLFG